jgi:hypothetical protein
MPRDKSWVDRVPEVREKLALLPGDFAVDRDLVESLFRVSARTALRILESLGAQPDDSGRLTLPRDALLEALASPELEAALAERQDRQRGQPE